MNKADLDQFKIELTDEDIDQILNDKEWEDSVVDAALLFAPTLSSITNNSVDNLVTEIINYNTLKRIHNLVLDKLKPLPKAVCFDKKTSRVDAIWFLENYISQVALLKKAGKLLKQAKLQITLSDLKLKNDIIEWLDTFKEKYNNLLTFHYKTLKSNECILTIK